MDSEKDMMGRKRSILLSGLIVCGLGGSLVLNGLLYHRAREYYIELNQTRLDPFGLNTYPTKPQEGLDGQKIRVVFFGDSRVERWTAPAIEGFQFSNRGIGSQTSVQIVNRFAAHVSPLKPDIMIIQVGINDLKTIGLFPHRTQEIVTKCRENIRRIIEASRKSGAITIVTTIFPVGDVPVERWPFWSEAIAPAVQEMNAYIATFADERTIVLETAPILGDGKNGVRKVFQDDELHLRPEGYQALNERLVPVLNGVKSKIAKK